MKKISNKNILAILVIVTIFVLLFSYFYFTKKQTENFQQSDAQAIIQQMKDKINEFINIINNTNAIDSSGNVVNAVQNKKITGISGITNYLDVVEKILKKTDLFVPDTNGIYSIQKLYQDQINNNLQMNNQGGIGYYIDNRVYKITPNKNALKNKASELYNFYKNNVQNLTYY